MTTTNSYTAQLASINSRWEVAQDTYTQDHAKLFRPDGSPIYSANEQHERLTQLAATLHTAADNARKEAEALRVAADAQLSSQHIDPLLQLTKDTERTEVQYKQAIVQENVTISSWPQLAVELRAMATHGSKVEKLLYVRYAGVRIGQYQERIYAGGAAASGAQEARVAWDELRNQAYPQSTDTKQLEDAKQAAYRFTMNVNIRENTLLGTNEERSTVAMRF